ncbi:MAG: O-antigen ligase family protein [Candidatus Doudnabacteria bacterium]|nr:O-antigen ligase family protein [Candidatus Doudnabacteria bacterium]
MAKTVYQSGTTKVVGVIFFILVSLSLLAPLWVFRDLLFPYVTSKAFFFRICLELALPFYVYLLIVRPELRPKWRRQYLNWLMIVFLILNLVSALWGDVPTRSLWGNFERMGGVYYIAHLTLLYFYAIALAQMGGSYFKRFLQVFLAGAMVVTINGIFGKLGLPTLVMDPSLPVRVSSTLGNPIYVGSFLIVPMFLAMFFGGQAEEAWQKYGYYFSAFLFFVGIVLSGTRGAMVGLIAGVFLAAVAYVIFNPSRKLRLYGAGAIGIFVLLCALLFAFNSKLPQGDFQRLFHLKDSNTSARLVQWGVALKGYKEHPWFGVGPENYYIISNKYYNPAIFVFDRSWFDKPHNYWIEVLVTDGVFAFITYLGILLLLAWALYKGYRGGFLTLTEFSLLLAALLAYQIQNLTVFDTVPASIAFYCLMGLAGFIWDAQLSSNGGNGKAAPTPKFKPADPILPAAAFGAALVVAAYLVYSTNIVPMEIAKAVNYGYAYSSVDPAKADEYFQRAVTLPFNFDKTQVAQKYAEFSINLERSATTATQATASKVSDESIAFLNEALATEPQYPILWQELAEVYLFKNIQNGRLSSVDPHAEIDIQKAIALAPGREEPLITEAQIQASEGNLTGSENILKNLEAEFPTDNTIPAQLATINRLGGKADEAAASMQKALDAGYAVTSASEAQWLVDYYGSKKQYPQALELELKIQAIDPNNPDVLLGLAQLYAQNGQNTEAIAAARAAEQSDPTKQKEIEAFITSLGGAATTTK